MSNLSSSSSDNSAREATCAGLGVGAATGTGTRINYISDARGHELGLVFRQIQFLQQAGQRLRLLGAAAAHAAPKNTTRRGPAVVATRNVEHGCLWVPVSCAALACRAALKRRRQVVTDAIDAFCGAEAAGLGASAVRDAALSVPGEAAPARKGRARPILAGPVQDLSRERWQATLQKS